MLYFPTSRKQRFCTAWENRKPGNCSSCLKAVSCFANKHTKHIEIIACSQLNHPKQSTVRTEPYGSIARYRLLPYTHRWPSLPRYRSLCRQEGQYPLTGQRAANFRLLDKQWAERRDAMTSRLPRYEAKCLQRRCFQCGSVPLRSDIKGTELPLPIYWHHSKGNWLRYNFAAASFYTLCSKKSGPPNS